MSVRAFRRTDLPSLLQLLGELAAERWPAPSPMMNSDVVWQLPGSGPKDNIRLWLEGDELVAFAWFQSPGHLHFDARDGHAGLLDEALSWALARRREFPPEEPFHLQLTSMEEWASAVRGLADRPPATRRCLIVQTVDGDAEREAMLVAAGFERTDHYEPFFTLDLARFDGAGPMPDGFTVRAVREEEIAARIAAHRAAWAPSTGFDATFYGKVRAISPPYDPALDLLAEAPDGRIACTAIFWADPISRIGSLEPFGTDPAFRGTGVSQAVLRSGFQRLKEQGMRGVRIYTAGFNAPAQRLYESVGFVPAGSYRSWLHTLP